MNILALDVGSTSMRGILFAPNATVLAQYSIQTPPFYRGNYVEQSPARLRTALVTICREIAQCHPVDAVALTAFRSAPTLLNKDGEPLYPFIMWQDRRNAEICRRMQAYCGDLQQRCGAPLHPTFTATKLTWLRENENTLWNQAQKAVVVPDYLLFVMTGRFVTDTTYGSRSLLMDLQRREWDDDLCRRFGVERVKLCELLSPGSVAGRLTKSFSEATKIKSGAPVFTAGGDQQCAALGGGLLDSTAALINSGTGAYALRTADTPVLTNPHVICGTAALPGKYLLETSVPACATALNRFFQEACPALQNDYEKHNQLAEAAEQGKEDALGKRIYALYATLAEQTAQAFFKLAEGQAAVQKVFLSGGVARSDVYHRMLSNHLGRPVYRRENVQATAIGAYASAAVTLGLFHDYRMALEKVYGAAERNAKGGPL